MSQGWFKLHRELFEKAIWQSSTPEQKVILIALLGMANHQGKEWEWKGKQFKAEPGQFVTSIDSIVKRCGKGISEQNVRTAIKKFKKYEFLTEEVTKTGRLITIVNWGLYQGVEGETNKQINKDLTDASQTPNKDLTDSSQTPNKQLTPNKNDKNYKNVNNDKNEEEREEIKPHQTPIYSILEQTIINTFGEIAYTTWFKSCSIDDGEELVIKAPNDFTKKIIEDKFKEYLDKIFRKKVIIQT
ncbi:DnaA N-terminal domain-containing protein [Clostridium novyi]|uniref:DnaA N-terminal domain-containing protein n=1 Tax=Clostridium novyi TaxID=1542 RepID=UPI00069E32D5|nr:DnaA N-terminal domain-containing protein [Clostridium novyi]